MLVWKDPSLGSPDDDRELVQRIVVVQRDRPRVGAEAVIQQGGRIGVV
jgi:hypothetical protein